MAHNFQLSDPALLVQTGIIDNASGTARSGLTFKVFDPATDVEWATRAAMDAIDTEAAIASAHKAFPAWAATPARTRAKMILKLDALVREHKEDLAQIITMETGKPLAEARGEVDYAASYCWLMAGEAERIQGDMIKHTELDNVRFFTTRQPIGPVGLLCPWNFPFAIALRKIAAAFAAGCTVVIKPSPETPVSTGALAVLVQRAGFAPGVMNIVTASTETTPTVGKSICEDPRIKKVSFTGSTAIGKLLMRQCSSTLKKMTLELGGNGCWVVFGDADLEKAASALVANKYRAAGQVCVCANRVYVQREILDRFAEHFKAKVEQLKLGHGLDSGVNHGPLTTRRGADRCVDLVADAVKHGAKVLTGGKRVGEGYHFEPTILVGASKAAKVYKEEMFSPIASLYAFDTEEEVIALCNNTTLGLTNYVFTKDLSRAFRCSDRLESGTVAINTASANAAESPFGGIKESGLGKEGGLKYGVEEFCIMKTTAITL